MTTIAFAGAIMASDMQAWLGRGEAKHTRKKKIHRMADGSLVGVSSAIVGAGLRFVEWLEAGAPRDLWPLIKDDDRENEFDAMQAFPDGTIRYWRNSYLHTDVIAEYFAIGSGADYALGALACGASASKAVEVACLFDPFSGQGMQIEALDV